MKKDLSVHLLLNGWNSILIRNKASQLAGSAKFRGATCGGTATSVVSSGQGSNFPQDLKTLQLSANAI